MSDERRSPSWKYIAGVVIPVLFSIATWLYINTQADIKDLRITKAEKEDVTRIEKKIDEIYNFLLYGRRR